MPLRALIFDFDGTLAETEELHRRAFNAAFEEMGIGWHWDETLYARLLSVAGGLERLRAYLTESPLGGGSDYVPASLLRPIHETKTRCLEAWLRSGELPLRPGVARLIDEAHRAGVVLGIATSTSRANVETLLESQLGPASVAWFGAIATGESVALKKPAPDLYTAALAGLAVAPQDCLALEDSALGLRSSLAAGIPTVVTISCYSQAESFPGATAVISDLGEPERPLQVLAGTAHGRPMVDLALAQRWHADALASPDAQGSADLNQHTGQ